MKPTVLIPARDPDQKLLCMVEELAAAGFDHLVVVDDGSSEAPDIFSRIQQTGAVVLRHDAPKGRGRSLKTGLAHCLANGLTEDGVLTADACCQYTADDIQKVAQAMESERDSLVLGVCMYSHMPLKIKISRWFERKLMMATQGIDVYDMDTGLRGIPKKAIEPFLALSGEQYDYESNMLLSAFPMHINVIQVKLEKRYDEATFAPHKRTLLQTLKFFWSFVLFSLSSLLATAVDYGSFALTYILAPGELLLAQVVSRGLSSLVNYYVNCRVVFRNKKAGFVTLFKFAFFSAVVMFGAYGLILIMNHVLHINVYVSKFVADNAMFFVGFSFQRDYVFGSKPILPKLFQKKA